MKNNFYKSLVLLVLLISISIKAQNTKILFDATKAEMAGSADWVIDADSHNIFFSSSSHLPYAGTGTGQSNPQRIPTPAQSGITSSTIETYWDGGLSALAVDCVKQGYTVETLPFNSQITYGNSANVQDLSNYKVFVVDEPNMSFSATEKAAIVNFVKNGGGLMMISDHTISDRNNDGIDSPAAWNDLLTNNTVQNNPFGIAFDLVNISGSSTAFASLTSTSPYYSILHGTLGNPNQVLWSNGTTMTLNTTANSSVKGLVFKSGSSTTGTSNVMVAAATYQSGKVFAMGDSSPLDDGTGDSGDILYNGYTSDASGNHRILLVNAIIWMMTPNLTTNDFELNTNYFTIAPNPSQDKQIHFLCTLGDVQDATVELIDTLGRTVKSKVLSQLSVGINYQTVDATDLQAGLYICKLSTANGTKSLQVVIK
ncbi:MAG: T9SS type A sorting domain-containing protein [Flavobacterium sp.]